MKASKLILSVYFLLPFSLFAQQGVKTWPSPDLSTYPKDNQGRAFLDGQVLVHFDKTLSEPAREALVRGLGYEFSKPPYFDGLVLKVPNGDVLNHIERLKNIPHVRKIVPNYVPQLLSYSPYPNPNDPNYQNGNDEWTINQTHMDQAWNSTDPWIANASLGRPSAVIAVVDTGARITHEEFTGKISSTWDFSTNSAAMTDVDGHGTAIAGIAGADVNNGAGGTGVCANCGLMILRVFGNNGGGSDLWIEEAFNYAIQNGARAFNCSFKVDYPDFFSDYSKQAFQNGDLIVGGMGNDGSSIQVSPAGDPDAIGVGAIDNTGTKCSFSNYGSWIGLTAPVCSPAVFGPSYYCDTCYEYRIGTSAAAPQVSAMAAILLDLGLSPAATKQCLYTTADTLGGGFNNLTGWGQLDCYRALASIRPASSLSASGGMTQVSLNWVAPQTTAFATADYAVSRSTVSGGPYNQVGQTPNGSTLSLTDTSPNPNTAYYYVVQAVDAQGNTTVVSNESSAVATGPTFTPTPTTTFTVTPTPTPNYGDMSGFTYEGLWHVVNDLTSPCPNSYTPPWAAYWGIDSQCNFQSGNTQPSTLICPPSLFQGVGTSNFWIWMDTSPNGADIYMATNGCGGWSDTTISIPQKTWFPISYNQDACSGVTIIASALSATGNTGRGIYIDAVGIGTPIPTLTYIPTGTISPTPTGTPTFNEFAGTPTCTATPTNTPTVTPTQTPSNTATNSMTHTASSTPTNTFTITPTSSPTNTPTLTFTPTSTDTPCGFPGNTCTPTATPTSTFDPTVLIHDQRPYPNPLKTGSIMTFWYELSVPVDKVTFKLFTVADRKVAQFNGTTQAGDNTVPFDLSDFANGLYFYVIEADSGGKQEQQIGKLLILR